MRPAHFLLFLTLLGLAGCRHIGPRTVADDRIAYNDAVATSWKQQILLNIVRVRYGDMAEFMEVGAIISSYELNRTTAGTFGAGVMPHNFVGNNLALGISRSRSMTDRPTIAYNPQATSEFTRNLLNPMPPARVLSLIEGGTAADNVMDLAVESINEIHNRREVNGARKEDTGFTQLLEAIGRAHASGDLIFQFPVETDKEKSPSAEVYMTFRKKDLRTADDVAHIRNVLHLDATAPEFKVVFGTRPMEEKQHRRKAASEHKPNGGKKPEVEKQPEEKKKDDVPSQDRSAFRVMVLFEKEKEEKPKDLPEIAIRTRSVLRVMSSLSEYVQVPASHLAEGRATHLAGAGSDPHPHLTVYSDCKKPCDCFAAIYYQGYWFWIDQNDARSKRTVSYLRTFLALADTGERVPGPIRTIRVN